MRIGRDEKRVAYRVARGSRMDVVEMRAGLLWKVLSA